MGLDAQIVVGLDHLFLKAPRFAAFYDSLAQNNAFRGLPVFGMLSFLWFDQPKQRLRLLLGLIGVSLATVISAAIQAKLPMVHLRPFFDPSLGITTPDSMSTADWSHSPNSFFSDTATLYGGLVGLIFIQNRRFGLFAFAWYAIIIALPRVVFGYHYPSDVIVGTLFGIGAAWVALRLESSKKLAVFRAWIQDHDAWASTVFVLLVAEMGNLFFSARAFLGNLSKFLHG